MPLPAAWQTWKKKCKHVNTLWGTEYGIIYAFGGIGETKAPWTEIGGDGIWYANMIYILGTFIKMTTLDTVLTW